MYSIDSFIKKYWSIWNILFLNIKNLETKWTKVTFEKQKCIIFEIACSLSFSLLHFFLSWELWRERKRAWERRYVVRPNHYLSRFLSCEQSNVVTWSGSANREQEQPVTWPGSANGRLNRLTKKHPRHDWSFEFELELQFQIFFVSSHDPKKENRVFLRLS